MRNYVIINGVNSLTIQGLAIKTLPPITKPIQRTLREEIDGRDGDLVTELGYGAYDKTIEIGLFGTFDIDEVIAYFNQKGTITFSNEADKVYYFQALEQVDYAELLKFRTANVVLHCQPFKYPTTETPIEVAYEYVEGTGESLTLDNTEASSLGLELKGNTSQQTYTGVNLFYLESETKNGVTLSYAEDGAIVLNGTSTQAYTAFTRDVSYNGAYTLSVSNPTTQANTYVRTRTGAGVLAHTITLNNTDRKFANMTTEIGKLEITIGATGVQYNNFKIYAQLQPSPATDWQPYVGGIPSPNPNYPQDIEVVTGDNEIEITGRNLFPLNQTTHASNGITTTYGENGEANLTGTISSTWANITNQYELKLPAGTYTISTNKQLTHNLSLKGSYEDGSVAEFTIYSPDRSRTFTTTKVIKRAYFYIGGLTSGTTLNETFGFQLEHGNTRHDFQKYQSQTFPLTLGTPNLYKESEATLGTISQSDGTTISSSSSVYYTPSYIAVSPNKDYNFKYNGSSNITIRLFYYTIAKAFISTAVVTGNSSNQVTFAIPSNAYFIRIQFGNTYYNQGLQLTKGSTPQTISDNPIEMCIISTYEDYFKYENEKWYLKEQVCKLKMANISSLIQNATYYQTNFNATNGIMSMRLHKTNFANLNLPQSNIIGNGKANKFIGTTAGKWNNVSQLYTFSYTDGLMFGVLYTDLGLENWTTSSRSFETELNNNFGDTIFYIPYLQETSTEITGTLKTQLDNIREAMSYNGQTNITQTNDNKPFRISASALKKGSDTAVVNNTGNIYSKPTIELEGTGIVDIYLNDVQVFEVDLSEENKITIDTEKMEAYTDTGLANRKVIGDYSTFKLNVGTNDLRFSGALTSATITRYLRWL